MSEQNDDPAGATGGTVPGMVEELSSLSSLLLGTDALDRVTWEAAMLAVRAIDEVDGCGVTVLREGHPISIMPDEAGFGALENLQYEHDAGPVPQAMAERHAVFVDEATAASWPAYHQEAQALGVVASLVVPLLVGEEVLGALTLYATHRGDLGARQPFAELVADLTSTALSCVARQAKQVTLSEELRTALESRAVIEQAKGMFMARGDTAGEAFERLRRVSQHRNVKLREIARIVVDLGEPGALR